MALPNRRLAKRYFPLAVVVVLAISGLTNSDSVRRSLSEVRKLCGSTFTFGDWNNRPEAFWEQLYKQETTYANVGNVFPEYEPDHIGYVLTLQSCPTDDYQPGVDTQGDPERAFYDAAAVLKYSICHQTFPKDSAYNATMYAVVHPDAIRCEGPNGGEYDRVKVLTDLGYHVHIKGSPVYKGQVQDQYVINNLDEDTGDRDLMKLWAYKFEHHPAIVMVDFTTMMLNPIDDEVDAFLADDSKTASYAVDANGGANTGFLMIKPNRTVMEDIKGQYITSSYDPTDGWNSQGVGGFDGALGSSGFLHHYYTNVNPGGAMILNSCEYSNDGSPPCQGETSSTMKVVEMNTNCGEPWECYWDDTWDEDTQKICHEFHRHWFGLRVQFEESSWHQGVVSDRTGGFMPDTFLGFCCGTGIMAYDRMIDDKLGTATCDPNKVSTTATSDMSFTTGGNAVTQSQVLELFAGATTSTSTACVEGTITKAGYEGPFNIALVIDTSGSTDQAFAGDAPGDANSDGKADTILDAEIAAATTLLSGIGNSRDLGNDNVNIGLISFSDDGHYRGMFAPNDPADQSAVNTGILDQLALLRSDGTSNYEDALASAEAYFQEAPAGRTNLLVFLSDGIASNPSDGGVEPIGNANSSPTPSGLYDSALGSLAAYDVQIMSFAVGSDSESRDGYALEVIDNTPDELTGSAVSILTAANGVSEVILKNPLLGTIIHMDIYVNDVHQPSVDFTRPESGPSGYSFGTFVVSGLDPAKGAVNKIKAVVTMDYDGDETTTDDQNIITTTTQSIGNL